jgi:hypothetical protein
MQRCVGGEHNEKADECHDYPMTTIVILVDSRRETLIGSISLSNYG